MKVNTFDTITETKTAFEVSRVGYEVGDKVTYGKICHTLKDIKQLYPFAKIESVNRDSFALALERIHNTD